MVRCSPSSSPWRGRQPSTRRAFSDDQELLADLPRRLAEDHRRQVARVHVAEHPVDDVEHALRPLVGEVERLAGHLGAVHLLGQLEVRRHRVADVHVVAHERPVAAHQRPLAADHRAHRPRDDAVPVEVTGPEQVAAAGHAHRQLVAVEVAAGDQVGAALRAIVGKRPSSRDSSVYGSTGWSP